MRYEGICCETCGWSGDFMMGMKHPDTGVDIKQVRICHHSSSLVWAADPTCVGEDWWCESWISEHHAKEHFYLKGKYEILDKCADEGVEP